jgi:DNA mismatch endonuclease (patch repair protein)
MSRIRGANTRPEKIVRSALHQNGFRFRLHRSDLPGKPDIVLPKYHAVIFVNGCFWHRHDCPRFKIPQTRRRFWLSKIDSNCERDRANKKALRELEWKVIVVWECALKGRTKIDLTGLVKRIQQMLNGSARRYLEIAGPIRPRS